MKVIRTIFALFLILVFVGLGTACTGAGGEQGPQGDRGADGVGVQSVSSNGNGTITITLSNGTSYTTVDLTGPQGPQGVQGIQGEQGKPGPNMIVATGVIYGSGEVFSGYNIASCTYDATGKWYEITVSGLGAYWDHCVVLATPFMAAGANPLGVQWAFNPSRNSVSVGFVENGYAQAVQTAFTFMVLRVP